MQIVRAVAPRRFEFMLFRAEEGPPPDLSDIDIQVIEPRGTLDARQTRDVRNQMSRLSLYYLTREIHSGRAWLFLAYVDSDLAHFLFVRPVGKYRKLFPGVTEPRAMLVGPGATAPAFRGRRIYPRVLQCAIARIKERGDGPFYGHIVMDNDASVKGIERAGFVRLGVWRGWRAGGYLLVKSRRISD